MIRVVLLLALTVQCVSILLCPPGWIEYNRMCYLFSDKHLAWYSVWDACQKYGAIPVTIGGPEENKWLATQLNQLNIDATWTGGYADTSTSWIWLPNYDIVIGTFNNWGPGEPSNPDKDYCLELTRDSGYKWSSKSCTKLNTFVCQKIFRY